MPINPDLTANPSFNKKVDICLKCGVYYIFVDTTLPRYLGKNLAKLITVCRHQLVIKAEVNELVVSTNGISVDLSSLPKPGQLYTISTPTPNHI